MKLVGLYFCELCVRLVNFVVKYFLMYISENITNSVHATSEENGKEMGNSYPQNECR